MRTINSTNRTAYLSGDVTPTLSATLRQLRLEFSDGNGKPLPLVYNTYNVIDGGAYASDDKEGRYIWGDSCTNGTYKLRILNKAVWGDTADYFASITADGDEAADWAYKDIKNSDTTPDDYCRIGVYSGGDGEGTKIFYVWYCESSTIYRETLTYTISDGSWAWSNKTGTGVDISLAGFDAIAIHPVSEEEAFVVAVKDHRLWAMYVLYDGGSWTTGALWTLWSHEDLEASDAYFSDAVEVVAGVPVLVVNLAKHGSAHSLTYDPVMHSYSQPQVMLGGGPDDATYRLLPLGLTAIDNRAWCVTYRALEGSDGVPYAYHVGLCSTGDGRHWRDEGFVGTHYCAGKLLYSKDDQYCYVAGNATVYRAPATYRLNYDNASLKKTITEAEAWRISAPGAGSATTVESSLLNVGDALSTSTLLRADNELTVQLGIHGGTSDTVFTGYLGTKQREEAFASDRYRLSARGPLYWLTGDGAYQPPAGKLYESPTAWYTNFNTEDGKQRYSIAQVQGTWSCTKPADRARWCMKGEPVNGENEGLAVVPRSISSPWLTCSTHFKMKTSVEGAFIVFFYEDIDNYWRAGIRNDSGTNRLVIERKVGGAIASKATQSVTVTTNVWYSLYLDLRPGMVRVYFQNTETDDFYNVTASRTLNLSGEIPPLPYHIGLSVLDRANNNAAEDSGTVTKSFAKQIQDNTKNFDSTVLGLYCWCNDDWRQVVDYTVVEEDGSFIALTVDNAWTERPPVGTSWGLYTTNGSPYVLFSDLSWCDGMPAWTQDDIVDDMLTLSGVGRTSIYTGTLDTQYKDLSVTITDDAAPSVIFHASATEDYTGWKVELDDYYHYLYYCENGGSWTLLRRHPNLVTIDISDEPTVNIIISDGNVFVYAAGHYMGCFANVQTPGYGYCAAGGSGTYTLQEFGTMQDAFVWGAEEDANSAIARLLRGRHVKLVERADGTVSVSEYPTRDDLGEWDTPVIQRGESVSPVPSLIGLTGAEVRTYYLEPETAIHGLRFRQSDNPVVVTEAETLQEARRLTTLARETSTGAEVLLYAPDPAIEPEDEVEVNGTRYIVNGYDMTLARNATSIKASCLVHLRSQVGPEAAGVWGTATYGGFKYS